MRLYLVIFVLLFSSSVVSETERRTLNNGNLILEGMPKISETIKSDLEKYQNVRSAGLYGWVKESILISTRFGNVGQLHQVDMPGGARKQLTFFGEPIGNLQIRPGGNMVAFTMDSGGNEYAQIFLYDLKSGVHKMITDGKSRNGALLWSNDGKMLAFQSNERNGKTNDIWIAKVIGSDINSIKVTKKLSILAESGSYWIPIDFNASGNELLVLQYISSTQSLSHVKNIGTGKLTLVKGNIDNESRNYAVSFSESGEGIFILTDRYGEFTKLVYIDLKTGIEKVISKGINWDVSSFYLDHNKQNGLFVINENGISQLYLFNSNDFTYKKIKGIPKGIVRNADFSSDGKKIALSINTSKSPTDVFVFDIKRNHLNRWTFSEVGGLDTEKFVEPELVLFSTFDKVNDKARKIPAFVYKPATKGPYPVIISIHGGPEGQARPYFSSTYQLWLKKLGAAVIVPNVRGSSGYGKTYVALDNGFKREDSVKDIGALLDWIKTQPDMDSNRVGVFGGSYGGYMVLSSAFHYSERLKAAVDVVGISNFVTFLKNTKSYRRDLRRAEYGDERDPKMNKFLKKISPSNNVEKINIPMFVVQGENDPRVPVSEAVQIVEKLKNKGNKVWYMNALNEGHGYRKKENRDIYGQATVMFFQKYLLN